MRHLCPRSPYRVLVFEPDHHGHRLSAVRGLIEALRPVRSASPRPLQVTLAVSSEAPACDEYRHQIRPIEKEVEIVTIAPLPTPSAAATNARRIAAHKCHALLTALKAGRYDHLYVPYADGLTQWLALAHWHSGRRALAGIASEAVLMRCGFAYDARPIKPYLSLLALSAAPFERIHLIDPIAFAALARFPSVLTRRLLLMPDPIAVSPGIARVQARRALGLPSDGRYIGCVGYQDERKGIPALISCFRRLGQAGDRLLLAGRQSPGVRALLAGVDDPRIVTLDRYLSEPELQHAISALDLLVTPYNGFDGSVSLCIRAAVAGRKVVAGSHGWMGQIVPAFELGWVCDVQNETSLGAAIARHLPEAVAFQGNASTSSSVTAAFCRYHQPVNVAAHWTAYIRQRLGIPSVPPPLPWPRGTTANAVLETVGREYVGSSG